MKKTDKLNKIKGYIIHCPTKDEATKLCKLLHEKGYKWCDGATYDSYVNWNFHREDTCYNPYNGTYARLHYYLTELDNGCDYNIIKFDEFQKIL